MSEVVMRKRGGIVNFEALFSKMADRAMGKKRSTADYPQTAWELILPILAAGWCSRADLIRMTGRNIDQALGAHANLIDKRGVHAGVRYRLKGKP